jgi:hypothetical protein
VALVGHRASTEVTLDRSSGSRSELYRSARRSHLSATPLSGPVIMGEFEIMGRYAVEGREPMYGALGIRGRDERVAPKKELSRSIRVHASERRAGPDFQLWRVKGETSAEKSPPVRSIFWDES